MKKLLTITAILFSVTLLAQNSLKGMTDTTCMLCPYLKPLVDTTPLLQGNNRFGTVSFWNRNSEEIAKIKSSGQDTLEITYPALIKNNHLFKYIKVGDKIFQEIEPIFKSYSYPYGWYQQPYYPAIGITQDTFKINYADTSYLIKKHKKQ